MFAVMASCEIIGLVTGYTGSSPMPEPIPEWSEVVCARVESG